MLGFVGYFVASAFGCVLAIHWDFSLAERSIALFAPGTAFIVVVTIATVLKGREWIVFYQATFGALIAVVGLGFAFDARVWRLVDITMLGIGVFLTFGRIGCFHVACCHGRLARRHGVRYGAAHVAIGFWRPWSGRPLVPIQLYESAGTLLLVIAGLAGSATPGTAALVYGIGYAVMRFGLELLRGDPVRPFAYGLSEAQWFCLATTALCAAVRPALWTVTALGIVVLAAAVLVAQRRARELFLPPHLRELDLVTEAIVADPAHARRDTHLGVSLTCHPLGDGRLDWILSSQHPAWSPDAARRIAEALWIAPACVAGQTPGVVHVIVSDPRLPGVRSELR